MTQTLRVAMLDAGYTEAYINTVAEYLAHKYQTAVKNAFKAYKQQRQLQKTAVYNTEYKRVSDTAYTLFGGFGQGQVRWLLRFADAETICGIMFRLRSESWARGWLRTKAEVEALARA
jgi:hypothetical protein